MCQTVSLNVVRVWVLAHSYFLISIACDHMTIARRQNLPYILKQSRGYTTDTGKNTQYTYKRGDFREVTKQQTSCMHCGVYMCDVRVSMHRGFPTKQWSGAAPLYFCPKAFDDVKGM